jgi:hypothetical protein
MRNDVHSVAAGGAVRRVTVGEPANFVGRSLNPIGSVGSGTKVAIF